MQTPLARELAPTGALRASINLGNAVLAGRDPGSGEARGVSVDLARALAQRLGLQLQLQLFERAAESVAAIAAGQADIGFFALDPQRAEQLRFTTPYVLIEGAYLVRADSPLTRLDEVDRAGHRVVVGQGSAYDLFLSRELKQAQIVRAPNSQAVVDECLRLGADVAAGVRQQLQADQARLGQHTLRLLPGHFMRIQQAMAIPAARSEAALACVRDFVEEMKASGFVAQALSLHGVSGVQVAPALLR